MGYRCNLYYRISENSFNMTRIRFSNFKLFHTGMLVTKCKNYSMAYEYVMSIIEYTMCVDNYCTCQNLCLDVGGRGHLREGVINRLSECEKQIRYTL